MIGGAHPYLKKARLRADIGCLYATLAEYSFAQIEGLLGKCHAVLMRDLSLPDFSFVCDTAKVKLLVMGVLLDDTRRGSQWWIED